jgi:hypothetical protein
MGVGTASLARPSQRTRAASTQPTRLWIGAALVVAGPLIAVMSTLVGMADSYRAIERVDAPTPADLAVGVHISTVGTVTGLAVSIVGLGLLAWALIPSLRPRLRE